MSLFRGRAGLWFVLGLALGVVGLVVLDGAAAGVALAGAAVALFVVAIRALRGADLSGVSRGGGEGGGFG